MYQLPPLPARKKPKPPYKKPESVRQLEALALAEDARRHPSIKPEYLAPRKYRDDTAGGLTQCIVAYSKLRGCFASRLNNQGVYRNGRYTRSTSRRGLPDVLITRNGVSLFIEVKAGRDRMSEHQQKIQQEQRDAGGLYFVARNFTDFKTWIDQM